MKDREEVTETDIDVAAEIAEEDEIAIHNRREEALKDISPWPVEGRQFPRWTEEGLRWPR